ncbi:MAG: beta-1,6-N-acetylglucosaminyltransferase [Verrucomicrobiota bacterium]
MGLAYCILAHKNPAQIARLLRALAHPDNVCVIHYDKRAPRAEHAALARIASESANVHLLPARAVLWGRYNVVGVQLEGIKRCLALGNRWSHFITLSGQDFPLQPQREMVAELEAARATSFLSFFDPSVEPHWNNLADRTGRVYIESPLLESLLKIPFFGRRLRRLCGWTDRMPCVPWVRREVPSWFRYMGGSNHVILSREAAAYLVTDPHARRIIQWLKYSGIPDESLFQSVLLNSPLAASVANDDRRAICWESKGSPSPITFTLAHLPWLRQARAEGKLFARKFDPAVDAEILSAIEKEIAL